jgi:putative SOS response-associated peptidase YedK
LNEDSRRDRGANQVRSPFPLINARSDTVAENPDFRAAFKARRCLIPATAFYNRKKINTKQKPPYASMMRAGTMFAFCGLVGAGKDKDDIETPVVQSCTIITTEANDVVQPVRDRMPVIVLAADFMAWLDPRTSPAQPHGL